MERPPNYGSLVGILSIFLKKRSGDFFHRLIDTVDGSFEIRREPVEVGSLSTITYDGFCGGWPWDFWTINSYTYLILNTDAESMMIWKRHVLSSRAMLGIYLNIPHLKHTTKFRWNPRHPKKEWNDTAFAPQNTLKPPSQSVFGFLGKHLPKLNI